MARAGKLSGKVEAIRMQLKAVTEAEIDPNVYALESVPAGEADGGAEVPIDQHLRLSQRLNRLTLSSAICAAGHSARRATSRSGQTFVGR